MTEENFSPEESLQLIHSMISKTKERLTSNRIYFLIWGWVSFIAILSQFFLKVVIQTTQHYLVWLIIIPAALFTIIYSARKNKIRKVRTYVGESMSSLWTGIGISFFILSLIVSNTRGGWLNAWPVFILFYGLGTFVSGKILKFKPLMIGGILNWALAVVAIYLSFNYQLLLAAAAILTSYIIPGHLLGSKQK